jgi:hypothetical protein
LEELVDHQPATLKIALVVVQRPGGAGFIACIIAALIWSIFPLLHHEASNSSFIFKSAWISMKAIHKETPKRAAAEGTAT